MREMSVTEQRYKAVLAVIGDGRTVSEVATDWGVSRRTMHRWLARYEGDGLEGLKNRSHRPAQSPHQMPPAVEAMVLEMRRSHPYWGARRIAFELARKRVEATPSESAVYRCLVRAAVIDPISRQRRRETWKRWERGAPMELWQLDLVHGFLLADGTSAKALTGVDDHSRYCVSARLMARERTQSVCDGFSSALNTYGLPAQVLTDNDKTLRVEFDTRQVFRNLKTAQEALNEWVSYYNSQRPHQALADATPESRFHAGDDHPQRRLTPRPERNGEQWVSRRVASNGLVSVGYQQVSVGKHFGGSACDVLVTDGLLQFWVGNELLKTVARTSKGAVRKLHADGTAPRRR